ncbi:hypothetical protein WR25_19154 [Diploscapter pachys]|uniref:SEC7 domain-containing protein n=1 Tax=Diploscapter pachys TaxID=2018661 RepID=A0A2A2KHQ2_9BILA|nr:hypothetical protein WR25_19154 [Diploscapter pachys]
MMATAQAQTGACETLVYPEHAQNRYPATPNTKFGANGRDSPAEGGSDGSGKDNNEVRQSPRCEAFVMTGEKILSLDHHVSPSYAKVAKDQLPPSIKIGADTPPRPLLSSEFPSVRRGRKTNSYGEYLKQMSQENEPKIPEDIPPQDENAQPHKNEPTTSKLQEISEVVSEIVVSESSEPKTLNEDMNSSLQKRGSQYRKEIAASNPQLNKTNQVRGSTETFIISSTESPTGQSTVTVNAINCSPANLHNTSSPAVRRILYNMHHNHSEISHSSRNSMSTLPPEEREAAILAAKMYRQTDMSSLDVAKRLIESLESNSLVSKKFMDCFPFAGVRIDAALRDFLAKVELCGESAQREKLLSLFSARYHECNPSLFKDLDEVHTLACALLLLNSDLHGPNSGKRMTTRRSNSITSSKKNSVARRSVASSYQIMDIDPESQIEYKCGWLMRKCVYDSDGTKTPFGRRGWNMMYGRLCGLVLYLDKNDSSKNKRSRYETFNNSVLLHHAFAEVAEDYRKKQHVFRLITANLGEYLFQTSSPSEVHDWVNQINFVCAAFSARCLPPSVSSQNIFNRPRYPNYPSTAPLHEQLRSHEMACEEMRALLARVRSSAPPLKSKGREVEAYFFNERYLEQQVARYEAYCNVLRARVTSSLTSINFSFKNCNYHVGNQREDVSDKISYREAIHS